MKRLLFISTLILAAPSRASDPIAITASIPARIVDGTPVTAVVTIEAMAPTVRMPAAAPHLTLRPVIQQLRDDRRRACFSHVDEVVSGTPDYQSLSRGSPMDVSVDLLEFFPLGFGPGRYALTFVLRSGNGSRNAKPIRSAPVEFEVIEPEGSERARYDEFRKICSALVAGDRSAPAEALSFADKYAEFPLLPGLLGAAMDRSADPAVRNGIGAFVESRYPGSALAQRAAGDRRWVARRAEALRRQQEHESAIKQYLQNPANAAEARAYGTLGSIVDAAGFERHERFVSEHASSLLAAEALHQMIVAVEKGVIPSARESESQDALVRSLRKRLMTQYPDSYRAREVAPSER